MPRQPSYKRHNLRNKAYVHCNGRRIYLRGEFGSEESYQHYAEIMAEYRANNHVDSLHVGSGHQVANLAAEFIPVAELLWSQTTRVKPALQTLKTFAEFAGDLPIGMLKARLVEQWVDKQFKQGHSRKYTNDRLGYLHRWFDWLCKNEFIDGNQRTNLDMVRRIAPSDPRCPKPNVRRSVSDEDIEATCQHMRPAAADLVRCLRLTGSRPSELMALKADDISRDQTTWYIDLDSHKTSHHGKRRFVCFGPQAREILTPRLFGGGYVFPSNKQGDKCYTRHSLRLAVKRAAAKAGVEHWCPYSLRHSAAEATNEELGLEAVKTQLGHSTAAMSEHYAKQSLNQALRIAEQIG